MTADCAGLRARDSTLSVLVITLGVLDVEDRLLRIDELGVGWAFAVLNTLLVDREVNLVNDVWNDGAGVLETGRDVVLGGSIRQKADKVNRVLLGQAETILRVGLAICQHILMKEGTSNIHIHQRCLGQWHHNPSHMRWRSGWP